MYMTLRAKIENNLLKRDFDFNFTIKIKTLAQETLTFIHFIHNKLILWHYIHLF